MAENEIVDIPSARRWKPIRDLIGKPNVTLWEVIECAEERLTCYLQEGLRTAGVLNILKAAAIDDRALRLAVANCKNQELARFIRDGIKTSRSLDPSVVSKQVLLLISHRVEDALCLYAAKTPNFESNDDNKRLRLALRDRFKECGRPLSNRVKAALTGERLRNDPRYVKARPRMHATTSILDRNISAAK